MNQLGVCRSGLEAQPMSWYCGCLLWASWLGRGIRWSFPPAVGSGFHGKLKPSWYLMVEQCSSAQVILEVSVVHCWLEGKFRADHDLIKEHLNKLDKYKLLARDKVYPWILNELVLTDVIARPVNSLWNVALRGCSWRQEEKSSLLSSKKERDLGICRPVSLSSAFR